MKVPAGNPGNALHLTRPAAPACPQKPCEGGFTHHALAAPKPGEDGSRITPLSPQNFTVSLPFPFNILKTHTTDRCCPTTYAKCPRKLSNSWLTLLLPPPATGKPCPTTSANPLHRHPQIALFPRRFCAVFKGGVYYSLRRNYLRSQTPKRRNSWLILPLGLLAAEDDPGPCDAAALRLEGGVRSTAPEFGRQPAPTAPAYAPSPPREERAGERRPLSIYHPNSGPVGG
jgi:hypothetical protein